MDVVAIRDQQQADEKKRLAAQAIQKQTPQGPQVVRGTPWQTPTTVSPEAQQSARRAEAFLNQRVDLTPKNNLAVPVPIVANNMASAPAPKPPAEITPLPAAPAPPPAAPTAPAPTANLQTQAGRMAGDNPQGRSFITGAAPSTTEGGPTGEVFTSRGASPGQRMMDRSGATQGFKATVDGVKGSAEGRTSNSQRGGFVGAATDAEAARNVQSRLEQDAAASQVVASMNRGADAERDTRATKLGISRAVLDQMEGRMDSPAVQAMQQQRAAQAPYEAMEQALSQYADESKAINALRDGGPKGFGQRRAAERYQSGLDARAAAAENMLNAGLGVGKERLGAETARQQARSAAQLAQFQEEGQNRRADLNARAQLQSTELAQRGGIAKEALQQQSLDTRTGTKSMEDSFKSGADYITAVTSADGKNPPQVSIDKLMRFREGLDPAKLTELVGKEKAHRIKAGQLHPEEAQWLVGRVKQWDEDPKSIWNLWTAEKETPAYSSASTQ